MKNKKIRNTWIKDIVHIEGSVIYIPNNYKEMIAKNEKYDIVYSNDSQCKRLLEEYFGGEKNAIPCEYAISLGNAGCSALDPFVSVDEALEFIAENQDTFYFGKWTNPELKKKFPNIPIQSHPAEIEKQFGITENN